MKKTIILCILFILFGFFLGREIIKREQEEKYYFLIEGIYEDKKIFEENIDNLRQKVLEYKNHKVYVYVGITKEIEIAEKLKEIYKEKDKNLRVEEVYLTNEEFKTNMEQFDLLVRKTNNSEEILKIEEVVLANYEEIIKNKE